jgi:hypothetical protein
MVAVTLRPLLEARCQTRPGADVPVRYSQHSLPGPAFDAVGRISRALGTRWAGTNRLRAKNHRQPVADPRPDEVLLVRDRLGIKPLYLTSLPGRIRFASTLPALLAPGGVDTAVDDLALHHYLSWHSIVPAPRTILKGVEKLPAATIRTVRADGTWCDREYWQPSYTSRKSTRAGPQGTGRRRWLRRCGRQYDGGWWPTCR